MKRQREHLGRKFGVKLWIPPENILQVAHDRTEGMVDYYLKVGESALDGPFATRRLRATVAGAYMQGMNDMIEAMIRNGVISELPGNN